MSKKTAQPTVTVESAPITDAEIITAFTNKAGMSDGRAAFARFIKAKGIEAGSDAAKALAPRWETLAKPFRTERTATVTECFKKGTMHVAYLNHHKSMGVVSLTDKGRAEREALKTAMKTAKAAAKS